MMASDADDRCVDLLVLAEVDHACGDVIATIAGELTRLGVRNVSLVPALTKKGRPGYLLFVDTPQTLLHHVRRTLAVELGVLGLRVLRADHYRFPTHEMDVPVRLNFAGTGEELDIPVKLVDAGDDVTIVSVEHDFCVSVQRHLKEDHGVQIALGALKSSITAAVESAVNERYGHTPQVRVSPRKDS